MAQNVVSKLDAAEEYIKMLKMNKDIQEQEKAEQRKERENSELTQKEPQTIYTKRDTSCKMHPFCLFINETNLIL